MSIHGLVHCLGREFAVNALHGLACLLHGCKGLAVDIGRLDGVDLLLQGPNLCRRLLQTVLMCLLPLEGSLCRYRWRPRQRSVRRSILEADLPFLFVLTYFRAIESCSSICVVRCFSRFCSISSCDRRPRMAFLGLSFFFWAAPPPNQPHTPDMLDDLWVAEMDESCARIGEVDGRGENCYR